LRVLLLNLPSPPGMNVERDFAGGFGVIGSRSRRRRYGHDLDKGILLPPLMEGYAATVLEGNGHEAAILDCQLRSWGMKQIRDFLAERDFDAMAARVCLPSIDADLDLLDRIAAWAPGRPTVVVWGAIASVHPEVVLARKGVDAVIGGEIEYQLPGLADELAAGSDPKDIPLDSTGLVKVDGTRHPDPMDLPSPSYELIQTGSYYDNNKIEMKANGRGRRFFTVLSSRGCPYGCSYCPYIVEYGRRWRAMTPEATVDEIERLVEGWEIEAIWFRDPTWNIDTERSIEICDDMISRELDIVWRAEMRADLVTEELASRMREAGCVNAQVGLETGDPALLSRKGKKGTDLGRIERGIAALRDSGIPVTVNVLVGLPGDSWSGIGKTEELIREMGPHRKNVAHLVPYPGTPILGELEREGWINSRNWKEYASGRTVVSYPDFSGQEIMMATRYLLDYDRPKEKYRRLLRNLVGLQLGQARDDLEWMARSEDVSEKVSRAGDGS